MGVPHLRVVVADDSRAARLLVRRALEVSSGFEVAGEAENGAQCVERVLAFRPDAIVMDVEMPVMDGIEATRRIMATRPTPILIFTSSTVSRQRRVPIVALAEGALDVMTKPLMTSLQDYQELASTISTRIRSIVAAMNASKPPTSIRNTGSWSLPSTVGPVAPRVIAVGASTGGPDAVAKALAGLRPGNSSCVLLVQHMDEQFLPGFVEWLSGELSVPVRLATDGLRLRPGTVMVADGRGHLELRAGGVLATTDGPPVNGSKPSADVLFQSVARDLGARAVGVLLTGMGNDGARGLLKLREAGALTLAQGPEDATIFGMPRAGIELGAACQVLSLPEICRALTDVTSGEGK